MNKDIKFKKNKIRTVVLYSIVLIILFLIAFIVFKFARPSKGAVPAMPALKINTDKLNVAIKRFKTRAQSIKELNSYQESTLQSFYKLNISEIKIKDPKILGAIQLGFEQQAGISSTGEKEKFLLLGDYAAMQFDNQLKQFLKRAGTTGVNRLIKQKDKLYLKLIKTGGNFITAFINSGVLSDNGELLVPDYIPQIVFRRRWRMLGGLPYRYNFLEIEALVDNYYLLTHTDHRFVDKRLRALNYIKKASPDYDDDIAKAIVYYEGKETKRAIAVLKDVVSADNTNFKAVQFLRFLKNR